MSDEKTNWCSLHSHSYYSVLDGASSVQQCCKRAKEVGMSRFALTDHGMMSGAVELLNESKKQGILGLIGIEFYVSEHHSTRHDNDNRHHTHLVMIAKDIVGYRQLCKMLSKANSHDCFYYKPRLSLSEIDDFLVADRGHVLGICGHMGSVLGDQIILEHARDQWQYQQNWKDRGKNCIQLLQQMFGEDNLGIEIQTYEAQRSGHCELIAGLRELCQEIGAMPVTTADSHYAYQEHADIQRILLCVQMKKKLDDLMANPSELGIFFTSDHLYIPSRKDLERWGSTQDELDNTIKITDTCQEIDLRRDPVIPVPPLPEGTDHKAYLLERCRQGFKKRYEGCSKEKSLAVGARVKTEIAVLEECGLVDYFLMMDNLVSWCKEQGYTCNGRGSAAGCVISYLLGITNVCPIDNGLIFERFYNKGRAETLPDGSVRYHLPDIDLDVPSYARDHIIEHLREQYGNDNVGQIVTFLSIKGKAALKDVCRTLGTISETEVNEICKQIPDEHLITNELSAMKERLGYSSIIQYCLEELPDTFRAYAYLNENNDIEGQYSREFSVARSLEGIIRSTGIHAAGQIVWQSPTPLNEVVPFIKQKDNDHVLAFEGSVIESMGCVKFDLLGLQESSVLRTFEHYVQTGQYKIFV